MRKSPKAFVLAFLLSVGCNCRSVDSPSEDARQLTDAPEIKFCPSVPDISPVPFWTMEIVFTETTKEYQSSEDMPQDYFTHIDLEGISVFTHRSFTRTDLNGKVSAQQEYTDLRLLRAEPVGDEYAAIVVTETEAALQFKLCIIGRDGIIDVGTCSEAPAGVPVWIPPLFYFLDQSDEEKILMTTMALDGTIKKTVDILPYLGEFFVDVKALGSSLLFRTRTLRAGGCSVAKVAVFSPITKALSTPWQPLTSEGFTSGPESIATSGDTALINYITDCHLDGTPSSCGRGSEFAGYSVAALTEDGGFTTKTNPIAYGSHHTWDGEKFAGILSFFSEPFYEIHLANRAGESIGTARMGQVPGSAIVFRGITAIGPSEYILNMSILFPVFRDLLVRVKITPRD